MDDKNMLRKDMKQKLTLLDPAIREEKNDRIQQHILSHPYWHEAKVVGLTVSRGFEVNTRPIIEEAWTEEKKVCVPKCNPKTREMTFYSITSFSDLENVYMDLYEPIIDKTFAVRPEEIDLMIVPGLLFNAKGYRIGFGGGYYDRYLEYYKNRTLSLAFDFQVIERLPIESFDKPVNGIVTDKSIFMVDDK
ncbi:5-formyltetrahydrofolate cyclo-ligase [Fictibacillus sp. Mic-4]|uniref:5-formyltetrahydrofolate cyclo-ligase n=1 Tax=Fictibacillus TaxID=1329200 RepID=UPI0004018AC5|nr:5-formyltetrahydrofolate cyclo-ligase [Fictibacillus gelatini]